MPVGVAFSTDVKQKENTSDLKKLKVARFHKCFLTNAPLGVSRLHRATAIRIFKISI
jgi:hypothetical protein